MNLLTYFYLKFKFSSMKKKMKRVEELKKADTEVIKLKEEKNETPKQSEA